MQEENIRHNGRGNIYSVPLGRMETKAFMDPYPSHEK